MGRHQLDVWDTTPKRYAAVCVRQTALSLCVLAIALMQSCKPDAIDDGRSTKQSSEAVPTPDRVSSDHRVSTNDAQHILANIQGKRGNAAKTKEPCPPDMLLVEGKYCPEVRLNCLRYLDPRGPYHHFRCAEYERSECLSKERVSMRFCIDRDEYTAEGAALPANHQSFTDADQTCRRLGKRVCIESEWNFACEGEEMRPYPYGWKRDSSACNADHVDITRAGKLRDLRTPADAYPRCMSPFGVRNMAGNVEEFVSIDGTSPVRPAMKGAYWQPSRNYCRAAQTAHGTLYSGTETGFRCCSAPDG